VANALEQDFAVITVEDERGALNRKPLASQGQRSDGGEDHESSPARLRLDSPGYGSLLRHRTTVANPVLRSKRKMEKRYGFGISTPMKAGISVPRFTSSRTLVRPALRAASTMAVTCAGLLTGC
jgi:hypothetical protein